MTEHIFTRFDTKIDKLVTTLVKMGSLAQDQIETVLKALESGNEELAKYVIERDAKIDKYDLKIDKQCLNIFALQQPVAMDLRIIMSARSINRNIERIGDHVVNIAERITNNQNRAVLLQNTAIIEMGKKAEYMVVNALDAFMNKDPDLARSVIQLDDKVDELHHHNQDMIVGFMQKDADDIPAGVAMISICRDFERLADEATNIAEEVIFAVDAEFIRHKPVETDTPDQDADSAAQQAEAD